MTRSAAAFALVLVLVGSLTAVAHTLTPQYHRVTIFGDSFAAGLYASGEAHTWRALLLNDLQPEDAVLIGSTGRLMVAPDAVAAATNDVATRNPDLVIVELGLNDVFQGTDPAEFESAARMLFDVYRGRTVVVSGIPWWGEVLSKPGDYWYDQTVTRDAILRRVAADYGYRFADVFPATLNHYEYLSSPDIASPYPPAYHGDGLHYGDAGHAALYRIYRGMVLPVLWLPVIADSNPR